MTDVPLESLTDKFVAKKYGEAMSGIRVVTRIIPFNTPTESVSDFVDARYLGKASFTTHFRYENPLTSRSYFVHTTYCEKIDFEPGTDVESAIAAKCESIPGLRCLRKNSKQSASEVKKIAVEPRCGEIGVVSLRDCMANGFRLNLPLEMPLVNGFITTPNGLKFFTPAENKPSSSTTTAVHRSSSNSTDTGKEKDSATLSKLLAPLYKYLVDNTCTLCGFKPSAKRKDGARRHLITHLTVRKFECEICKKGFVTPESLSMHKRVHLERLFVCERCDMKYKDMTQLKVHMRIKHTNVKSYKCAICEKNFSSPKALKEHHRTHTGEKPYQCDVCLKKFQTSGSLRTHVLHHADEKPFICSVCGKGYTRRRLLQDHMNTHEKKSVYRCDQCRKGFNFKPNLLQHMKSHTNLRKHECGTCGMKFKFPHHLKSHINTHNNVV